jgi:ABC-type maltose transport system permease subunit
MPSGWPLRVVRDTRTASKGTSTRRRSRSCWAGTGVLFASVLTNPQTRTAAVTLALFGATQEGGAIPLYGQLIAASLVCATPVVLLHLTFQRYLVGGLTTGGVK